MCGFNIREKFAHNKYIYIFPALFLVLNDACCAFLFFLENLNLVYLCTPFSYSKMGFSREGTIIQEKVGSFMFFANRELEDTILLCEYLNWVPTTKPKLAVD